MKEMNMMPASIALGLAQERNRTGWVNEALGILSTIIAERAKEGLRSVTVDFWRIFKGCENLTELGEVAVILEQKLKEAGYKSSIDTSARFIIEW